MMTAIRSIHAVIPDIVAIFGFGSFFRGMPYHDCDILVVIGDDTGDLGHIHFKICHWFQNLGNEIGIIFDVCILTEREHYTKPLREHNNLFQIFPEITQPEN
jgi:hypothetical protein